MYLRIFVIPSLKLNKFIQDIQYVLGIIPSLNQR